MPLADYSHWNEDAEYMWWHEEGKHEQGPPEPDPEDPGYYEDDYYECQDRPNECLAEGNFNCCGNGVWVCSTCEDTIVVETREGTFVPYPSRIKPVTPEQILFYREWRF